MKGRKPQQGATVGIRSRRASKNEPPPANEVLSVDNPDVFKVEKPEGLSKGAAAHWDKLMPKLIAAKLVCALDVLLLTEYCETAAQVDDLKRFLKKNTCFVGRSNGPPTLRAECKLYESLQKKLVKFSDCLGLSPAARKRMGISLKLNNETPKCPRWEVSGDNTCACAICAARRKKSPLSGILRRRR